MLVVSLHQDTAVTGLNGLKMRFVVRLLERVFASVCLGTSVLACVRELFPTDTLKAVSADDNDPAGTKSSRSSRS